MLGLSSWIPYNISGRLDLGCSTATRVFPDVERYNGSRFLALEVFGSALSSQRKCLTYARHRREIAILANFLMRVLKYSH